MHVNRLKCCSSASQRLAQAPARIADIWDTLQLGLNLTGLTVVDAPQLTVAGQLASLGVRLDDSTANSTTGWVILRIACLQIAQILSQLL